MGERLPLALQQIHALVGKMADQRGGGAVVAKQDFPYGDGRGGGEDVGDEHGGADAAARRGSASENAGEDEGEEHGNGRADQRKRDGVPQRGAKHRILQHSCDVRKAGELRRERIASHGIG